MGILTGDNGVGFVGYYSLNVTLLKCYDVQEVLEVQVVASDDVRMVPDLPTDTK